MPEPKEVALDFSGVKPFEPMNPDRLYLCSVSKLALGTSKPTGDSPRGNPKASLELTIVEPKDVEVVDLEGNLQGSTTRAAGRKLFREFSLQPQALPFLYEFLKAVDPNTELGDSFRFRPNDYMGLQCAVRIKNEEFEEQVRARVQRFLPASRYSG